jgi:hypothetical protein
VDKSARRFRISLIFLLYRRCDSNISRLLLGFVLGLFG